MPILSAQVKWARPILLAGEKCFYALEEQTGVNLIRFEIAVLAASRYPRTFPHMLTFSPDRKSIMPDTNSVSVPSVVLELVQRFVMHHEAYKSSDYKMNKKN